MIITLKASDALSKIPALLILLLVFSCGVDHSKSEVPDSVTSNGQDAVDATSKTKVQTSKTKLGFSWSDQIYSEPLYDGETKSISVNIETDCEYMGLHILATFQSVEVEELRFPLRNSSIFGECETEIEVPANIRPMWVRLDIASQEGTIIDHSYAICLNSTMRNIEIMNLADGSNISMDAVAKSPRGAKLVNPRFTAGGCDKEKYWKSTYSGY